MFDRLRKHRTPHKKGPELLMDMLPAGKPKPSTLPLSREISRDEDRHAIANQSNMGELEAGHLRAKELDAEAPGSHILEMESKNPLAELNG